MTLDDSLCLQPTLTKFFVLMKNRELCLRAIAFSLCGNGERWATGRCSATMKKCCFAFSESYNAEIQIYCFPGLVFTLVLSQICKSCWGKSCISSSGKVPQNWLAFYRYRWQDHAVVSNTPGCGVLDALLGKKEARIRGNAIWVYSGVAFFHRGHWFICLERSWIYFTA